MEEIQDLNKQLDFSDLTYHYKGKNVPNKFEGFKGPLGFCRSKKEGNITSEKVDEQQKEFKSELSKIVTGSKKSEDQKSAINDVKAPYEFWEKIVELFDNHSRIVSKAIYKKNM